MGAKEDDLDTIHKALHSLTVVELKEELRKLNLSTTGPKVSLVNRLHGSISDSKSIKKWRKKLNIGYTRASENWINKPHKLLLNYVVMDPLHNRKHGVGLSIPESLLLRSSLILWRISWISWALLFLSAFIFGGVLGLDPNETGTLINHSLTFVLIIALFATLILLPVSISYFLLDKFLTEYHHFTTMREKNKIARKEGFRSHQDKIERQEEAHEMERLEKAERIASQKRANRLSYITKEVMKKKPKWKSMASDIFPGIETFHVDLELEKLNLSYQVGGEFRRLEYKEVFSRTYKSIEDEMIQDFREEREFIQGLQRSRDAKRKVKVTKYRCRGCMRYNRVLDNALTLCDSCQEHSDY